MKEVLSRQIILNRRRRDFNLLFSQKKADVPYVTNYIGFINNIILLLSKVKCLLALFLECHIIYNLDLKKSTFPLFLSFAGRRKSLSCLFA